MLAANPILSSADPQPSLDRVISILTPDLESQDHILRYQLPVAVRRHNVGLVVLDSVAANYRAEFERPGASRAGANMAVRYAWNLLSTVGLTDVCQICRTRQARPTPARFSPHGECRRCRGQPGGRPLQQHRSRSGKHAGVPAVGTTCVGPFDFDASAVRYRALE